MPGLVSKNVIYLKVDEKNRPDFEARGLAPFTYKRNGKDYFMSYHEVFYQTMDDAEELCEWGKSSRGSRTRCSEQAGQAAEQDLALAQVNGALKTIQGLRWSHISNMILLVIFYHRCAMMVEAAKLFRSHRPCCSGFSSAHRRMTYLGGKAAAALRRRFPYTQLRSNSANLTADAIHRRRSHHTNRQLPHGIYQRRLLADSATYLVIDQSI